LPCEVRAGRLEKLKSFDEFLESKLEGGMSMRRSCMIALRHHV